jgi:hypothetical protein
VGVAWLRRSAEEGHDSWLLTSETAVDGSLAVVTVCFDDDRDLAWALDISRSLDGPVGEA